MSTATILKSLGRSGIKVSNVPQLSSQPWIAMTGRPFSGPHTLALLTFETKHKIKKKILKLLVTLEFSITSVSNSTCYFPPSHLNLDFFRRWWSFCIRIVRNGWRCCQTARDYVLHSKQQFLFVFIRHSLSRNKNYIVMVLSLLLFI